MTAHSDCSSNAYPWLTAVTVRSDCAVLPPPIDSGTVSSGYCSSHSYSLWMFSWDCYHTCCHTFLSTLTSSTHLQSGYLPIAAPLVLINLVTLSFAKRSPHLSYCFEFYCLRILLLSHDSDHKVLLHEYRYQCCF